MASRIHKRKDGKSFIINFRDVVANSSSIVFTSNDMKKALKKARQLDCDYYNEHRYLIPSGISLEYSTKRFRVYTRYGYIGSHSTLMEAVEQKQNVIADLTELKYIDTGKNRLFTN